MKNFLKITAIFVIITIVLYIVGVGCPIKYITGVSCPGCGLTRAYMSLAKLNIIDAFKYHPLFWTVPIIIVLYLNKVDDKIFILFIILFIAVYVVRLINVDDEVVTINLREGLILKIINLIKS